MKKFLTILGVGVLVIGSLSSFTAASANAETNSNDFNLTQGCKSAYLMDYDSGECIYKENERTRTPIASVCKVMTLTLCFDAVESGELNFEDEIYVSENAASMGGSQVFLESGYSYPLSQLIKSIVVCSANDSCVAVAEKISGSEEQFVAEMNKKAKNLGLTDTLFSNCTGLPKDTQYSCAADVAVMFANLISHQAYFDFSGIWLEDFTHGNGRVTSMTNTNKLIRKYQGCDGGKTGFTGEAGYCLACTAKKNNLRFVSVVLGADTSDNRFQSTVKMLDYGFANYKNKIILDSTVTLNEEFELKGGKKKYFSVFPAENCYMFSGKNKEDNVTFNVTDYKVKAPVAKGQKVGVIEIYKDGVLYKTIDVISGEDVKKATFGDNFKKAADGWDL